MASREGLLQSIQPGMKLTKSFFLRVYGYEITWPGFAELAISRLNVAGCGNAKQYYEAVVSEYEERQRAELRTVSKWFAQECEKEWKKREKGGEARRKQEIETNLHQMNNASLIALCANLTGVE